MFLVKILLRIDSEYMHVIQKGPSETAGKPGGEICEQKQDYLGKLIFLMKK